MWTVAILPYSLEANQVGKPCGEAVIWQHRTPKAAGRRLASIINRPYRNNHVGMGAYYVAISPDGTCYSLKALRNMFG